MNRREFCRQMAAVSGAALLSSCRTLPSPTAVQESATAVPTATFMATPIPTAAATTTTVPPTEAVLPAASATPQATAQSTATMEAGMARVALVRTTDRAQGVRKALELLNINPVRGNRVLFKPNLNSSDPPPGSTHPTVMRSLLLALQDMGARSITLGERSGMGDTRQVMQDIGVFALADELGFSTAVFDELAEEDWVVRQSGDYHWSDGFAVPKLLLDSECVVQTCNLKTHKYGGHFTLSLKNSVGFAAKTTSNGGYNYMTELHNSDYQRHMIAEINTVYKPSLILMDGVEAFLDGGPAQGSKAQTGVMLAGTDPVAMDAVGVAILRLFGTTPAVSDGRIFDQEQIARAVELDLGVDGPEKISVITADAASQEFAGMVNDILMLG